MVCVLSVLNSIVGVNILLGGILIYVLVDLRVGRVIFEIIYYIY